MSPEARESSFDELTRGLASGSISRGKALRLMGAAVVGGALASLGIGEAAADPPGCKRNGKKCKNGNQCCSLNCSGGTCAAACVSNGGSCSTGGTPCCSGNCKGGTCVESCIPPNAIRCDPNNPTAACSCTSQGSGCVPEVDSGETYCRSGAITQTPCATSCDCPTGQFCEPSGDQNFCAVAC